MIERAEVNGQKATVVYLSEAFEPVDRERADLIKVIFDDGRIVFLHPRPTDKTVHGNPEEGD